MPESIPATSKANISAYALMTASYWGFTVTDGALRMLVLLHFHQLGYTPLQIASLFIFYEFFGVVTNLVGGWIALHLGLKTTLTAGLLFQVVALSMLALMSPQWSLAISVTYVMAAQALSGIAKDLVKMSSKSSIKLLVKEHQHGTLFKWVAILTGSKNALKGFGFFLGGLLLGSIGFVQSLLAMAFVLMLIWLVVMFQVAGDLGRTKVKIKIAHLFSKSSAINKLSAARFFLFGSRDIWFVVGLPLTLSSQLDWSHAKVGAFLAAWVIGYGFVQILAPILISEKHRHKSSNASWAAFALATSLAVMLFVVWNEWSPLMTIVIGLSVYGFIFAINSSIHSYLILAYGQRDQISMDVGFYYMANAGGRLVGTLLSGCLYQAGGLFVCLLGSFIFVVLSWLLASWLPAVKVAS